MVVSWSWRRAQNARGGGRVVEEDDGAHVVGGRRDGGHQVDRAVAQPVHGAGRPAPCPLGGVHLDAAAAEVGRRPAVHHPLVADQAPYGPVRAGRHRRLQPGVLRGPRERRHRVAQGDEISSADHVVGTPRRARSANLSGEIGVRPSTLQRSRESGGNSNAVQTWAVSGSRQVCLRLGTRRVTSVAAASWHSSAGTGPGSVQWMTVVAVSPGARVTAPLPALRAPLTPRAPDQSRKPALVAVPAEHASSPTLVRRTVR